MTIHRLSHGGADRVAMLLANGFAAHALPVGIAVLRIAGEGERMLVAMLDRDVRLDSAGRPLGSRHLELVRGVRYISGQIRIGRPAIVLASSSNMGLVTGLCARLLRGRRPRFVMKLTNPVIRPRDRGAIRHIYRRLLYRFIFGSYDSILVLSDAERDALSGMFPALRDRFRVVANPYVTAGMLAAEPPSIQQAPARILTAARMMPQKRLDRLLEAFARVVDRNCRLVILGEGPHRERLERLARTLGIADRITMPGFVEDVVPWLRGSALFVLSSDYEGLPAAVFEALACNVPVVTTDCFSGARALLADMEGCEVVAREDIAAFAEAVDRSLARRHDRADLRDKARPYEIDRAIAAHIAALEPSAGADRR